RLLLWRRLLLGRRRLTALALGRRLPPRFLRRRRWRLLPFRRRRRGLFLRHGGPGLPRLATGRVGLAGRAVGGGTVAEQIGRVDPVLGVRAAGEGHLVHVVVVVLDHRRVFDLSALAAMMANGGKNAGFVTDAGFHGDVAPADGRLHVADQGGLGV